MPQREVDEATSRSEARKRRAETRAQDAQRRVVVARRNADLARNRGNARAAAVHDHEAAIHQRAVEIHLQAVRLQQDHARELLDGHRRRGIDEIGLRHIISNVRRARDEAALRGEQARTYSLRARERAQRLEGRGDAGA